MKDLAVKKLKQNINTALDNCINMLNKDNNSTTDNEFTHIIRSLNLYCTGLKALSNFFYELRDANENLDMELKEVIEIAKGE